MKNKDKVREIIKIGIVKHLKGLSLKDISNIHDKFFFENNSSLREKSFIKNLTMTSIRNRGIIEYRISKHLKRPLPKKLIEIKAILIMGVAQILFTRVEDYAAVNTTVNFFYGKLLKWRALSNAILRNIIREQNNNKKNFDQSLNIPKWLHKKWRDQFGEEDTKNIICQIFKEPQLDLKVKKDFNFWKKKIGGEILINNTLRLNKKGDVTKIIGYDDGAWWVQNLAAQIPAMLLGVSKNEEVLDLCSSPGGKTAQLLNMGALVTALDISAKKVKKLNENIARLRLNKNLTVLTKDLLKWDSKRKYSKIILDVPCSATGTIRKNPDILWNKTEKDISRLSKLQIKLLEKAITLLKNNGILIYCNCSLQFEEGEKVIDFFIKNKKVSLLEVKPEELKQFPNKIFNKGLIRTLPCRYNNVDGLDGFFIARLVKI